MEVIKQRQPPKKSLGGGGSFPLKFFSHSAVDATEKKGGKGEAVTDVA